MFDCEHFFDGFKNNPEYAYRTRRPLTARLNGLSCANGGAMPEDIEKGVAAVKQLPDANMIHCHNDCGLAGQSIAAILAGVRQSGSSTGSARDAVA